MFTINNPFVSTTISAQENESNTPLIGVNLRGYYTTMSEERDFRGSLPKNYYEDSFRLISEAGMNHVRYVFFWEAYIKHPNKFINELITVAQTADKYGIKVLYDNHQFHT
jgi:aryl-phospho-beta-D-glucosidase BglC (GH1 family)